MGAEEPRLNQTHFTGELEFNTGMPTLRLSNPGISLRNTLHCTALLIGVVAVLMLGAPVFGQGSRANASGNSGVDNSATEATGTASLSGGVFDAVTGSPLTKAEVRLMPAIGVPGVSPGRARYTSTVNTDGDGRFQLTGIPSGDYMLSATRRAYSTCGAETRGIVARQQGCASVVSIQDGQAVDGVELRLQPAAVITGLVTDEDGEPMAGVVVSAQQYRYMRGNRVLASSGNAVTDDRGVYRLYNLAPGRYYVMAQKRNTFPQGGRGMMPGGGRGSAFARAGAQQGNRDAAMYTATYYPAGASPAESIPLQLNPGAEMGGIDFRLAPKETYSIEGVVTGFDTSTGGGAMVIVRRADGPSQLGAFNTSAMVNPRTGTFVARGLTPGRYEVIARAGSPRRGPGGVFGASGRTVVDVGNASLDGVTVALRSDAMLPGKIVLPKDAGSVVVTGIRVLSARGMGGGASTMRVDDDGSFQVPVSAAEAFEVSVENLPEGFYVKAMNVGGVNLLESGAVPPSEPTGVFEVQLGNDGGTVSGVARNGNGDVVASARVALLAEREGQARKVWSQSVVSGEDGAYSITGVAPGRYRAYVFEDLAEGPALDPEILSQFGQRGKSLEVRPKGTTTLEAQLIPASDTAMLLGEVAQ